MNNMKTAGIICEYNPFHNGHRYHIEQTREKFGATHICAVMSGNFTQRGDVAVFDKFKRAEAAVKNGVDLVIELPVAFSLASAEQFAFGAVSLLNSLGNIDIISFGSESGDMTKLKEAAGAVEYCLEHDDFFDSMRKGKSYPAALQETLEKFYTEDVFKVLTSPNNTLAVEYLKAISSTGSKIEPVTIKRSGVAHDSSSLSADGKFASASQIRSMLRKGEDASELMPAFDYGNCADIKYLETAILYKLRTMSAADLVKIANINNGLENSIVKAAKAAISLGELLFLIKSKRYTLARMRRALLCAFLGISKKDLIKPPAYVRILAMNDKGKEIIANSKCEIPVNASLAMLRKTGDIAKKQAYLEEKSGNIYALAFDKKKPCGLDYITKPYIE